MHILTRKKQQIRFRRWSRKPFAVFASLKVCVTIGRLRAGMADCSLSKRKGKTGILLEVTSTPELKSEKEAEPYGELSLLHGELSPLIPVGDHSNGTVAAGIFLLPLFIGSFKRSTYRFIR